MRSVATIVFNIILALIILKFFYNSNKDYSPLSGKISCLNQQGAPSIMCAQCVTRPLNLSSEKGIFIDNKQKISVLQIAQSASLLTCPQYLQLVDYYQQNAEIYLDKQPVISQIVSQIQGKIVSSHLEHFVSPDIKQFVIYRRFSQTEQKWNMVYIPNQEQIPVIQHFYLYILNLGLFVVCLFHLSDKTTIQYLPLSVKFLTAGLIVVLELVCLNVTTSQYLTDIGRVMLMVSALSRIDMDKSILIFLFCCGFFMSFSELSYSIFVSAIYLILLVKGSKIQRYRHVWAFLLVTYFIYTLNQFIWYFVFEQAADTPCRIIQLNLLVTTPLSFLIIKDRKSSDFRSYRPSDPEQRSISLSGFEQDEDDEYRG